MRAQVQFNWIFVIIVGALILLFFVGFTIKYKDLQEQKQEIILLNNFDDALKSLERSSFTTSTNLNLIKEVKVSCDENVFINTQETSNLLFSDEKLKNKILIWYQPYELPFFITNFYYLIDDKKYYLVVNNDPELNEFVDDLIDDLPSNFQD
ncbi:MAG: hypothetical protein KJ674_04560, partial [Nanoarchaeota archaeon]|nr:hypothetical protein [Nanoarchaeota archaeon]